MKIPFKCLILAFCFSASSPVYAASWPEKPIRLVVPFPAGGASDSLARTIGNQLTNLLGQTVVVENKTGAGGVIGTESVARAKPDGYTILLGTIATHAINPSLRKNLSYDAAKDFDPIILLGSVPNAVLSANNAPFKSIQELVERAKAAPGTIAYASAGAGTSQHLSGELFQLATGTKLNHVPYRGGPNAIQDVMGGQIPMSFETVLLAAPQVNSGKLNVLAVTSGERSQLLPDVPTLKELGIKDFDVSSWQGIWVPVGTPTAIISKLNTAIADALNTPDGKKKMLELGMSYEPNTPAEFGTFVTSEQQKWAKVISTANIQMEP